MPIQPHQFDISKLRRRFTSKRATTPLRSFDSTWSSFSAKIAAFLGNTGDRTGGEPGGSGKVELVFKGQDDILWREFVLDTELYDAFCEAVCPGFFIDRSPNPDGKSALISLSARVDMSGIDLEPPSLKCGLAGKVALFIGCDLVLASVMAAAVSAVFLQMMVQSYPADVANHVVTFHKSFFQALPIGVFTSLFIAAIVVKVLTTPPKKARKTVKDIAEEVTSTSRLNGADGLFRQRTGLDPAEVRPEFARFFALLCPADAPYLGMKSYAVDEYWHEVVADTALYRSLCLEYAMRMVSHNPGTDESAQKDDDGYAEMLRAYVKRWRELPPRNVWPYRLPSETGGSDTVDSVPLDEELRKSLGMTGRSYWRERAEEESGSHSSMAVPGMAMAGAALTTVALDEELQKAQASSTSSTTCSSGYVPTTTLCSSGGGGCSSGGGCSGGCGGGCSGGCGGG